MDKERKEKALKRFNDFKKSGKKFTLGDVLDDKDKEEFREIQKKHTRLVVSSDVIVDLLTGKIPKEYTDYIMKFYKKAKALKKDSLSNMTLVNSDDPELSGSYIGFTYVEDGKLVKIFLEDDIALIEFEGEEPHEIGLYELE